MWRCVLVLASLLAFAGTPAFAQQRVFTYDDYTKYFSPGLFRTHSPFYESDGQLEVKANRKAVVGKLEFLEQTVTSLDVSRNYDTLSEYPYYKIKAEGAETMMWDKPLNAWVYDYADAEFSDNDSEVWISKNARIEISPDDRRMGALHGFYKEADKRAKANVKALDDAYRKDVVGVWSMQCSYLSPDKPQLNGRKEIFDVECRYTHQPSKRVERYYYRKLDLMS